MMSETTVVQMFSGTRILMTTCGRAFAPVIIVLQPPIFYIEYCFLVAQVTQQLVHLYIINSDPQVYESFKPCNERTTTRRSIFTV